jgi:GTP-binding protein SAR1
MEELRMGDVTFQTFDLGGHSIARRLWREYYADVSGIVYLFDTSDRTRFAESKAELDDVLAGGDLSDVPVPVLVLGNKIDVPGAVSEDEVRLTLGLLQTYGREIKHDAERSPIRPIELFMCSIVRRQGYKEGLQWLAQFM